MPSKKRKYNARFPAGRIKKIMQTDEDVGKVAQAVPVIISRTLELFVESLLTKAMEITNAKNAKTLSPSHMKQCILSENRFDFLKDLVKNIPDINNEDNNEASSSLSTQADQPSYSSQNMVQNIKTKTETVTTVENLSVKPFPANFYTEQSSSNSVITNKASVIQYSPKIKPIEVPLDNTSRYKVTVDTNKPPKFHLEHNGSKTKQMDVPPLVPIIQQPPQQDMYNNFSSLPSDNLCIDEDYDN